MKWTLGDIRAHFAPCFGSDGESMGDSGYGSSTGAPTGAASGRSGGGGSSGGGNVGLGSSTGISQTAVDFANSAPGGMDYSGSSGYGGESAPASPTGAGFGSPGGISQTSVDVANAAHGGMNYGGASGFGGGDGGLMTNATAMRSGEFAPGADSSVLAGSRAAPMQSGAFQTTPTGSQAAPTATGFNPELPEWGAPRSYDMTPGTRGTVSDLMFEPSPMQGWQNTITTQQTPDNALSPQMSITDQPDWQGTPTIDGLPQQDTPTRSGRVNDAFNLNANQFNRLGAFTPDPYGLNLDPEFSTPATGIPFNDIGSRLMNDLQRDFNLTQAQAAGVVGNLAHETADFQHMQEIQPMQWSSGQLVPSSTARGGFGYAQWTGSRRNDFESWARDNNLDPSSYEANYGFLVHELTDPQQATRSATRGTLDAVRGAQSANQAATVFSNEFLRPGIPHMASRQDAAQRAMDLGATGTPSVTFGTSGNTQFASMGAETPPSRDLAVAARDQVGQPTQRTEVDIDRYVADVPTPSRLSDLPAAGSVPVDFSAYGTDRTSAVRSGIAAQPDGTRPSQDFYGAMMVHGAAPDGYAHTASQPADQFAASPAANLQSAADTLSALDGSSTPVVDSMVGIPPAPATPVDPVTLGFDAPPAPLSLDPYGMRTATDYNPSVRGDPQFAVGPGQFGLTGIEPVPAPEDIGVIAREGYDRGDTFPISADRLGMPGQVVPAGTLADLEFEPTPAIDLATPGDRTGTDARTAYDAPIGPSSFDPAAPQPPSRDAATAAREAAQFDPVAPLPPSPELVAAARDAAPATITSAAGTNIPVPPAPPDPRGAEVDKQNIALDAEDVDTDAWTPQLDPETGELVEQHPAMQRGLNIAGGLVGGQLGAGIGAGLGGPVGAVAGGLLGSWAGNQLGNFSPAAPGSMDDQMGGEGDSPQQPIRRPQQTAAAQAPAERVSERYLLPMFDRPDPQGRRMTPYERFIADRNNYGRSLEG